MQVYRVFFTPHPIYLSSKFVFFRSKNYICIYILLNLGCIAKLLSTENKQKNVNHYVAKN